MESWVSLFTQAVYNISHAHKQWSVMGEITHVFLYLLGYLSIEQILLPYPRSLELFPHQPTPPEARSSLHISIWKTSCHCVNATLFIHRQIFVFFCIYANYQPSHLLLCTLLKKPSCCHTWGSFEGMSSELTMLNAGRKTRTFTFTHTPPLERILNQNYRACVKRTENPGNSPPKTDKCFGFLCRRASVHDNTCCGLGALL